MTRVVQCSMVQDIGTNVDLIFAIATHPSLPLDSELLSFSMGGEPVAVREIIDDRGARIHRVTAGPGLLEISYQAASAHRAPALETTELELLQMRRPSRYAESDILFRHARQMFTGLAGLSLVNAVRDYVHSSIVYAPESTTPTDSATVTLQKGRGVCRDFAHLCIALLRAMDISTRYVAVYAPGLVPMDFHAVAEAYVDGEWHVIDATGLTDRMQLVRISTGRDAADCAFLTYHGGPARLQQMRIDAWVQNGAERIDPSPAHHDQHAPIRMS